VLKALDDSLIPNAQNSELKGLLTRVRGVVAAHLDHAKQLQKTVK
jgi:putative membrane protein